MKPGEFEANLAHAFVVELRETVARAWMKHPGWEWSSGMLAVPEDGPSLRVVAVEGEFLLLCKPLEAATTWWANERRYAPDAFDVGTAALATATFSRFGGAL